MKKERGLLGRLFNGLLSVLVAITILPAVTTTLEAANENINGSYVSLPITIRDYASDGMLFEFNEYGIKNDVNVTVGDTYSFYKFYTDYTGSNASDNDYKGIRITTDTTPYKMTWWHYILCNSDGSIAKVSANGEDKSGLTSTSGQFWVLVWGMDTDNYNILAKITESNKENYKITYTSTNTFTISNKNAVSGTYHLADTKGFGLLQTADGKDIVHDLKDSSSIAGTELFSNGTWNQSSEPASKTAVLNSGAVQEVNGAYIRTNLVEGKLGENGKPQYTKATVEYLANYMRQVMPTEFSDGNGNYYLYSVMGAKLSDLGNEDLASKIRAQLKANDFTLGDYTTSKTKFDNGNLNHYSHIQSCTDAAYFLLHNLYSDNTGYGKTATEYNTMHLVEKTDSTGTYYEFNSGYDNTAYDTTNKSIYNTQNSEMTIRGTASESTSTLDPSKPLYIRGNALPYNRFNPLHNLGYGNAASSDTYKPHYQNAESVSYSIKAESFLYDETNYHMSLEGHAKFIYYYDSNMYFSFTGDDDVYLYINGIRVLDLGAAHSISKATININDVAKLCGLKDGEAYDFDFYFMERHGTAANFGIKTNIKIVDPSMLTTKKGYQDGGEVGYNGFVNAQHPVTYEFGLQNNGETDIKNLVFDDPILGVYLSKDTIKLNNPETTITDLTVTKFNVDGTVAYTRRMGSEDELKEILADILKVGEKIQIYGIDYTIPANDWVNNAFPNTLHTKATPTGENTSTRELNGIADYVVQKQEYNFGSLHYYDWGTIDSSKTPYGIFAGTSKGVTATKDELIAPVDKLINFVGSTQSIQLCSASGNTTSNINSNVTLNSDGSVTYVGTKTGADSFYYLVKDNGDTYGPVRVDVYVYGVADNIFVLDYGLSVDLNESDTSFMLNDVVSLTTANPYGTEFGIVAMDDSKDSDKYGQFTLQNPSLTYKPNKIMNDDDTVTVTISVIEVGKMEVTKTTGVTMIQEVKVAPASVMYYEDNFEGLTYVGEDGNQWLLYEAVDENGNVTSGSTQSADQESNYGSDPNYDPDKQGTLTLNKDGLSADEIAAAKNCLAGDASNGTISALKVNKTAEILNFTFDGTGFEILSRTTSEDYAVLNVTVTNTITNEVVYDFPVISESINGDLYQIPVIAATDMPYGTYKVSLKAARSKNKIRMVYIDGVRIYGALAGKTIKLDAETTVSKEDAYYSDDEKEANVKEIKRLIKDNKIAYAYVGTDENDNPSLITGSTLIEEKEDTGLVLTPAVDLNEYLTHGPNNEIYMDSDMSSVVTFYLIPKANVAKKNRTVQIGAHRKSDFATDSSAMVNLVYGDSAEDLLDEVESYDIASGTEQYYTIDMDKLTPDEDGRYLVMIGSTYGENIVNTLTLTNLKLAGYELETIESEMIKTVEEQDDSMSPMMYQVRSFRMLRTTPVEPDVDTPIKPEVNTPIKPEVDTLVKPENKPVINGTGNDSPITVIKPLDEIVKDEEVDGNLTINNEKNEENKDTNDGIILGGILVCAIAALILLIGVVMKKKKQ